MSNIATLPTLGQATYQTEVGTYTFGPASLTTKMSILPQYDKARRTVTALNYSITVEDLLEPAGADGGMDDVLANAVNTLNRPAGRLTWANRGAAGPQRINFPGAAGEQDLTWGPMPRGVQIEPQANESARITWSCDWQTKPTMEGEDFNQIMEFNFTMDYSIDAERQTTRRYSGFIRIPQSRFILGGRVLFQTADQYRGKIVPVVPTNFVRLTEEYSLDESKNELTFAIVDHQMAPNAWPTGVTSCRLSHSYSNTANKLTHWTGSFDGEFVMARGASVESAVKAFFAVFNARRALAAAIKKGDGLMAGDPPRAVPIDPTKPVVIRPLGFTVEEPEVFGVGEVRVRIRLSYGVVGCGLPAILQKTGLWTGVKGTSWAAWYKSVAGVYGPRGSANLIFSPLDDGIQDLADPGVNPVVPGP